MKINEMSIGCGVSVSEFVSQEAGVTEVERLRDLIYEKKIVILKNQAPNPRQFVEFGRKFGKIREYYEDMYHHPEEKEIFVSSNVKENGELIGVPRTGKFWHSDYAFMREPFAFTMTYPQVVPKFNRGTYFIDMAESYNGLSPELKRKIKGCECEHSVRKYFKVRPKDLYQPIGGILREIEEKTPPVFHPAIVTHPVTDEKILYISEGFTMFIRYPGGERDSGELLQRLLESSGQLDKTFRHPYVRLLEFEKGDIIIWDNRRFIHHAKHSDVSEPTKTYRLTIYDQYAFSASGQAMEAEAAVA